MTRAEAVSVLTTAVVWYAILQHFVWGVSLLCSDGPAKVSSIAVLGELIPFGRMGEAIVLTAVSIAAAVASVSGRQTWKNLALITSQQLALFVSMYGALTAVVAGQYADGYTAQRSFIFCDQFPHICIPALHAMVVWQHFHRLLPGRDTV